MHVTACTRRALADDNVRALTLNLHCHQEADALGKLRAAADFIAQEDIDIVLLQEVGQSLDGEIIETRAGVPIRSDNAAYIMQQRLQQFHGLDFDMHFAIAHIGFDRFQEGEAVLVRGSASDAAVHVLDDPVMIASGWSRIAVSVVATLRSGHTVTAMSAHLGWWGNVEDSFEPQFGALASAITSSPQRPVIIGADLNAPAGGPAHAHTMRTLRDAYLEANPTGGGDATFPGLIDGWSDRPGARMDYILVSQDWPWRASEAAVVLDGSRGARCSDHFGVMVDFDMPTRRP